MAWADFWQAWLPMGQGLRSHCLRRGGGKETAGQGCQEFKALFLGALRRVLFFKQTRVSDPVSAKPGLQTKWTSFPMAVPLPSLLPLEGAEGGVQLSAGSKKEEET
ncbi:hypothetical protein E2320_001002, partial [Naja naja]